PLLRRTVDRRLAGTLPADAVLPAPFSKSNPDLSRLSASSPATHDEPVGRIFPCPDVGPLRAIPGCIRVSEPAGVPAILPDRAGDSNAGQAANCAAGGSVCSQPDGNAERYLHLDEAPCGVLRGARPLVLLGWLAEERPVTDGHRVPGAGRSHTGALLCGALRTVCRASLSPLPVLAEEGQVERVGHRRRGWRRSAGELVCLVCRGVRGGSDIYLLRDLNLCHKGHRQDGRRHTRGGGAPHCAEPFPHGRSAPASEGRLNRNLRATQHGRLAQGLHLSDIPDQRGLRHGDGWRTGSAVSDLSNLPAASVAPRQTATHVLADDGPVQFGPGYRGDP